MVKTVTNSKQLICKAKTTGRGTGTFLGIIRDSNEQFFLIFFIIDFIKEGCPSTEVGIQGALHLKTLLTIYNIKLPNKKKNYNIKPTT